MTRAAAFKLSDVQRAVRAVQAAGLRVHAVEIAPDGNIRVLTTSQRGAVAEDPAVVAWEQAHGLRPDQFSGRAGLTPLQEWELANGPTKG